jgi:hypothetical protein
VVAPAPNPGNSGLIVAAPGSTVVVQQAQAASQPAKPSTTSKTNFFASKNDAATIIRLGNVAANRDSTNSLGRAGAIDALGLLGAGADEATLNAITERLRAVINVEFLESKKGKYTYGSDYSEFLCFHVVQAAGNLGWGARSILPDMQLLRGNNPILDTAIDRAVSAMQTSPAPQTTGTKTDQGSGTPTP